MAPTSGEVWLPINFGLFPDLVFREEEGLAPDFWVPAADAVNFAVAAVRKGTIATARRLPAEWLQQEFVPEDPRHQRRKVILACLFTTLGFIWAVRARRSRFRLVVPGVVWLAIGVVWVVFGGAKSKLLLAELGMGLVALGLVLILSGLVLRIRTVR